MVAKTLAEMLGDTELLHFSKIRGGRLKESVDMLGLIFPVYWGGLPYIVLNSISALKGFKSSYTFSIATHAGGPGTALSQLRAELEKNGLELNAGKSLKMPSNYILGYDAPSDTSIKSDLAHVDRILHDFAEKIKTKEDYRPKSDFPHFSGTNTSYQRFIAAVNSSDVQFRVDDTCTGCGVCESVCPVQNIKIIEGRPTWHHKCEQCLACINWCPEVAIQHGTQTSERGRYVNPRISMEEMKH